MKFDEFITDPKILQVLHELGFETPTPIQERAIPEVLKGGDLRASAQTGTGNRDQGSGISGSLLTQIEEVKSCNGYYSASDLRIHFGLGEAKAGENLIADRGDIELI